MLLVVVGVGCVTESILSSTRLKDTKKLRLISQQQIMAVSSRSLIMQIMIVDKFFLLSFPGLSLLAYVVG
jgi:hypothetical protein